jgi:hypothetical protein
MELRKFMRKMAAAKRRLRNDAIDHVVDVEDSWQQQNADNALIKELFVEMCGGFEGFNVGQVSTWFRELKSIATETNSLYRTSWESTVQRQRKEIVAAALVKVQSGLVIEVLARLLPLTIEEFKEVHATNLSQDFIDSNEQSTVAVVQEMHLLFAQASPQQGV